MTDAGKISEGSPYDVVVPREAAMESPRTSRESPGALDGFP
ncbi:hypothetical protein SBADM41S_11789 [Streptomyces badius]